MKEKHKAATNWCIKKKLQQFNISQDDFYKKPWFWICITIIIYSLTRPNVKVTCGNANGNGCSGNSECRNQS